MSVPALKRLQRILDLEAKQGWRNRAVVGGMGALRDRWMEDALAEDVDAQLVAVIGKQLVRYEEGVPAQRRQIIQEIRHLIKKPAAESESRPGPDPALDAIDQVGTSKTSMPSAQVETAAPSTALSERAATATEVFQTSVKQLHGVGDATAEKLARLGIHTLTDLVWHLPFRYDDFSQLRTIAELQPGEQATVVANLWQMKERKLSMNRQIAQAILNDGTGTLRATWWSKWAAKDLVIGKTYRFSGKVGLYMGYKTLEHPLFEELNEAEMDTGLIVPVYHLTADLSLKQLHNFVRQALEKCLPHVQDPMPGDLRRSLGLIDLGTALLEIHIPTNPDLLSAARKRLAFDEFFYIQLGVQRRRHLLRQAAALALPSDDGLLADFRAALPFELTGAQRRVVMEIAQDIARTVPMSRLVQGDVGSGKTVVAAGAMFIAAANGAQSALLAPTQILAEQHYRGLSELLEILTRPDGTKLNVALLTGRVSGSEREAILAGLAEGSIDVAVGTTALIQEGVEFKNLGFVVVDEQHRFGVEQRGALRDKGGEVNGAGLASENGDEGPVPHMLVMSATPIPRSLALTIYGDLDVSVIDELPPGRTPIQTKWFQPRERERLYSFLRRRVQEGRQGFIIYPLVEESDKLEVGAAVEAHTRLSQEIFPDLKLGLLHGRLSGSEKDDVMQAFAAGEYDILVSTSVVEVGIDVPNATVMIIEDAERFGLAQLHQLRGRVGRGEHESYCALISKGDSANAAERLQALVETTDGFALAEKDLALRGPGDFFGTRQSGLPDLHMAVLSDTETLSLAQRAARELFAQDPDLSQHPQLLEEVERFWRGHGDVS